ncbi:MAG: HD domain-containing protein, partial [bacterium]
EQLQIIVKNARLSAAGEYDPSDFLPAAQTDAEELYAFILAEIKKIKNGNLKRLLESFFGDPEFKELFKRAPAAKSIHHSYIGGLIEHTTNCLKLGAALCEIYPRLNRELLLAGIMLHDVGKTREFSFDTKINYTDEGRLLGHITIGENMIRDRIKEIEGFPESLAGEFLHMIISHHGENMTGSPKRPKTAEACALHHLENLDAQTKRFLQIIESVTPGYRGAWTPYDRLLDRYLFRGLENRDDER